MNEPVRPTKKQRELLDYIESFITEYGYSPSYREIMNGLQYNSVATVALHVGNLIKRGHLRKRDHSARSLEVVVSQSLPSSSSKPDSSDGLDGKTTPEVHEMWLVERVEARIKQLAEESGAAVRDIIDMADGRLLFDALHMLGLNQQAQVLQGRLIAQEVTQESEMEGQKKWELSRHELP